MKIAAVVLIAAVTVLAACGGDSGGGGQAGKPATLKVGVIPIADVAPLYLGRKKGFFKKEKLTIDPQLAEGGAAITPAVVSGDFQIGFSNTISLLIASSKNLPVEIITQGEGRTRPQHFDPQVLEAFGRCAEHWREISDTNAD